MAEVLPKVEKWKHLNIFETYLLMGPSRTLTALSEATGVSVISLRAWNKAFKWAERVDTRDRKMMAAIEAENNKVYIETVKKRHQQAYQVVTEKALDYLTKKNTSFHLSKSPARDASIALDIGVKGERDVLGLRDTKLKGAVVKEGFAALIEMIAPS